ncbi:hypothetical protein Tco_0836829 [Tanacetum coccineum]
MADTRTMAQLLQAPTEGTNSSSVMIKKTRMLISVTSTRSPPQQLLDKKNQTSAPVPAPAPVKAVELSCVTCGGAHSHQNCPATHGNVYRDNISEYVSQAAAANYNQVSSNFRPQMVANHIEQVTQKTWRPRQVPDSL